jgi:hypothetical protein
MDDSSNVWEEIEGLRRALHDIGGRVTAVESENAELRERVSTLEAQSHGTGEDGAVPHAAVAAQQQQSAAAPPA